MKKVILNKWVLNVFIVSFLTFIGVGCVDSTFKDNVENEKKVCSSFLLSIKKSDLNQAVSYFGETVFEEQTEAGIKSIFNEMRDTFGYIERYDFVKYSEIKEQKGKEITFDHNYIYHVEYSNGYQLLLNFTFHHYPKPDDKIDAFSVDEYE